MKFNGKIIAVIKPKSGISKATGREWKLQEFVLETKDERPQSIVFSIFGDDKISECNFNVNDNVTVDINFKVKEYNGRYFNSLLLEDFKKHRKTKEEEIKDELDEATDLPF